MRLNAGIGNVQYFYCWLDLSLGWRQGGVGRPGPLQVLSGLGVWVELAGLDIGAEGLGAG